jgi:Tfp pilus assembly protein PilV
MLTFPSKPPFRSRRANAACLLGRPAAAGGQDGFLLIEVLISALILSLIAAATLTGMEAVDKSNANQRFHNEAVLLAAQSQEDLRTAPVSALEKLLSNPHVYTQTVDNNKYTITQEVHQLNAKEETSTCTVVEHGSYTAPNFRVSTSVVWSSLQAAKPVTESSIITPPTSSSLEVDVGNAPTPTKGVPGVTAIVTYASLESGINVKLEGTTGIQGCVVFTGIRATSAEVEIAEAPNFVTPSGTTKVPAQEVSIAPNQTTRDQVTYDEGGAINAVFTYKGKTEYEGKQVTGDTFVVSNTEMNLSPELEVGTANEFTYEKGGEERYTAKPGSPYRSAGVTAKGGHYERGDLFPFLSDWTVFAGDCAANNPLTVTGKTLVPAEVIVNPGATQNADVELSYVNLQARIGNEATGSKTLDAESLPVKITNTTCASASPAPSTPDNAAGVSYVHTQHLTAGALEAPFQPFGKFELCVQAFESATKPSEDRIDRFIYENTAAEGAQPKIYPQELPQAGEQKAREEKEAAEPAHATRVAEEEEQAKERAAEEISKPKREKEEETLKLAGTKEASAKSSRESEEAANRKKWEEEEKAKKISKATREADLKAQTKTREEDEKAEKLAQEKRTKELETLKTTGEAEAKAKTTRTEKEIKTGEAKTKQEATSKALTEKEKEKAAEKEKLATEGKAQKVEEKSGVKC